MEPDPSSIVRTGVGGGPLHATRGAAGNQVAWLVLIHALELRPGAERRPRTFMLDSASRVAPTHPLSAPPPGAHGVLVSVPSHHIVIKLGHHRGGRVS